MLRTIKSLWTRPSRKNLLARIDGLCRLNGTLNADLQVVSDEVACWRRKNKELLESYDSRYDALSDLYRDTANSALMAALTVGEKEQEVGRLRRATYELVDVIHGIGESYTLTPKTKD